MEVYGSDGIDVEGLRWWMGCFGTVGEFDSRQCRGVGVHGDCDCVALMGGQSNFCALPITPFCFQYLRIASFSYYLINFKTISANPFPQFNSKIFAPIP